MFQVGATGINQPTNQPLNKIHLLQVRLQWFGLHNFVT
jgi:hypothetical protein